MSGEAPRVSPGERTSRCLPERSILVLGVGLGPSHNIRNSRTWAHPRHNTPTYI